MRTLIQSGFSSQSIRPRMFVRIADASDNTILLQGTKAIAGYEDRISNFGTINQGIAHVGGLAEVSGASFERIILDEDLTLCTTASIPPNVVGSQLRAGRLLKTGAPSGSYLACRGASSATDFQTPAIVVGRNYSAGILAYQTYRAPLEFAVPSGILTLDDAYIELTGMAQSVAAGHIHIEARLGTWSTTSALAIGDYTSFIGWQAADAVYTGVNLIEDWTSDEYADTVYLRFTESGRDFIRALTGSTLRIMLLSANDVNYTAAPTGAEFAQFEASTALLQLRYNSLVLDNQDAEILLGFETLPATISNTTVDAVWKGVVDSYKIGDRVLSGELRQNDHKKNCTVPARVITKENWPDCPEENIGKAIPAVYGAYFSDVYGEHKDGIGIDNPPVSGVTQALGVRDYVPALVVRNYGGSFSNPGRVLFANRTINNMFDSVAALWNSTRKTFERYWIDFVDYNPQTAPDGSVYLEFIPAKRSLHGADGALTAYEDYIGRAFSVIPSRSVRYDATNPEHAYSGVSGEYALLTGANAYAEYGFDQQGTFAEREKVEAVFNIVQTGTATLSMSVREIDSELNGATATDGVIEAGTELYFRSATATFSGDGISEDDLLVITSGVNAGEWPIASVNTDTILLLKWAMTPATGMTYKIMKRGAELENTTGIITTTGQKCVPLTTFTNDPSKYIIRFDQTAGAGSFQISLLQVRMYLPEDEKPETVYFDMKGHEYGSWITGRGETSGDLIENPAHVIEAFARDEMGILTAGIDTAAFDAAATARTGDKFAFQLLDRKPARDLLNDLAYQARLSLWWDEKDRITVKAFDADATFPHSGTNVPGALDIFTTTGTPVSGTFTNHPIFPTGDDFLSRMDMDDCKNDFVIKYKKNYATGEYSEVLTCNKDSNNLTDAYLADYTAAELDALCTTSEAAILTRNTLTVEAWAIRDEATANKLMEHLIVRLHKRRWICAFKTGISALCFEPGDFVNIRDERIYDLFGTAVTERKKWMITAINPALNNCTIEIKAIEV